MSWIGGRLDGFAGETETHPRRRAFVQSMSSRHVVALVLSLLCVPAPAAARPLRIDPTEEVVRGIGLLGFDLYAQVRDQPGNLVLSPASIGFALGMVHGGAAGATRAEIASVLHYDRLHVVGPVEGEGVQRGFVGVLAQVHALDSVQLRVANRMWAQKGNALDPGFLAATKTTFGAALALVDFVRGAPAARKAINAWVATATAGHIVDLLPAGSVSRETALVLVNAIWFKGTWANPFDRKLTHDAPFTLPSGELAQVKTMQRVGPARFGQIDDDGAHLRVLELDYAGKGKLGAPEVSMVVLLPDDANGLPALEQALDLDQVDAWMSALHDCPQVDITLPRFGIKAPLPLADLLKRLGMRTAFSEDADFSSMLANPQKPLHLSGAFHQAFVSVDESGTVAAAATAMAAAVGSAQSVPTFHADHPFIWLIRDKQTGLVLFLGRVVDPR
jgi:serpin B